MRMLSVGALGCTAVRDRLLGAVESGVLDLTLKESPGYIQDPTFAVKLV